MSKIIALAGGTVGLKLALAGMHVENTDGTRGVETRLGELLESDEASVVVVQEEHRSRFSEWFTERLRRHKGLPLVVYCPSFEDEESNVDAYLAAVLKPAIGYEIRLE